LICQVFLFLLYVGILLSIDSFYKRKMRRMTLKVYKAKSSAQSIMLEIRSRSLSHNEIYYKK